MKEVLNSLSPVWKAAAGALSGAIIAALARFGFNTSEDVNNAIEVIVTAALGALSGYLAVYFAPRNGTEVK